MSALVRRMAAPLATFAGVLAVWELATWAGVAPHYILPSPIAVAEILWRARASIAGHALATGVNVALGLLLGSAFGAAAAIALVRSAAARRWMLPILIAGQAVPVFALAPLFTLWFGLGAGSKIAMTVLVVYFPVTASFYDGLRRADPQLLAMARVMGASPWRELVQIRLPAALPALGSGLRLAAVFAPVAAIVGEWTGSREGLGYLMNVARGRLDAPLLFAALVTLGLMGVALHAAVSALTRAAAPWARETTL